MTPKNKSKLIKYSIISEVIILIIGTLSAWLGDKDINTFDTEIFKVTVILCIILVAAIVIRIYPII